MAAPTDSYVELEIRVEGRFVLWALRCRFWRFGQALCDLVDAPGTWHSPTCECVSRAEFPVLEALNDSAALDTGRHPLSAARRARSRGQRARMPRAARAADAALARRVLEHVVHAHAEDAREPEGKLADDPDDDGEYD